MMPMVPAFATDSTAHCRTCEGDIARVPAGALFFKLRTGDDFLDFLVEFPLLVFRDLHGRRAVRVYGVDSDGVDRAVGADAAGQVHDRVDGVVLLEIDDLGPVVTRLVQPRPDAVHRQHAPGALELRLMMANWPTGPQPKTVTVWPGWMLASRRRNNRWGRCRTASGPGRPSRRPGS